MSYANNSSAGPSRQKQRKLQNNEPLPADKNANLTAESSDETSDFSDGEYILPDQHIPPNDASDDEDDEHIVQGATWQQHDSMVEDIIWEDDSTCMKKFNFTKTECLLQPILGEDPIDYFRHCLNDSILDEITSETNDYARKVLCHRETKKHSRIKAWKDTTNDELLIFVGLILHMGTIRMNRIQDYWKTDNLFGLHVFSDNMSRNRFLLLLRALHFANIPEQNAEAPKDQLCQVKSMVNLFNTRLSEIYYPSREISLGESMIFWHGQPIFRQYVPNEHHKYGIKLYMITTPDGIVLKFMVDTGSDEEVMLKLLDGMLDVGHNIFIDNSYNSYELVKYLADRKTHCTGTIRKNSQTFPKEVRGKKLKKGETVAKYANGIMIAKWKDKQDVTYISNKYKNDIEKTTNTRGETRSTPSPVVQYNKFMTGINKQDQMLAYYPCERKTIRAPAKIFMHILQIMMMNSYFMYNKYKNENMSLYDFRLLVIGCLLKQPLDRCAPVCNPSELKHVLTMREEKKGRKIQRKHCKRCYSQRRRKDTIYICKDCEGTGYCLDCAIITHK